jgi:hypothetical protein
VPGSSVSRLIFSVPILFSTAYAPLTFFLRCRFFPSAELVRLRLNAQTLYPIYQFFHRCTDGEMFAFLKQK